MRKLKTIDERKRKKIKRQKKVVCCSKVFPIVSFELKTQVDETMFHPCGKSSEHCISTTCIQCVACVLSKFYSIMEDDFELEMNSSCKFTFTFQAFSNWVDLLRNYAFGSMQIVFLLNSDPLGLPSKGQQPETSTFPNRLKSHNMTGLLEACPWNMNMIDHEFWYRNWHIKVIGSMSAIRQPVSWRISPGR